MIVKTAPATIQDLYNEPGKAELVGGRIIREMATGGIPSRFSFNIACSLREHAKRTGIGEAFPDNTGFTVPKLRSGRESFSPDVAFVIGLPISMKFVPGAPVFAVEVRSETECADPASEADRAAKRADYFEAGTQVVWDVDPISKCVHSHRKSDPMRPITFNRGQQADAEPAVTGWRMNVDAVFE